MGRNGNAFSVDTNDLNQSRVNAWKADVEALLAHQLTPFIYPLGALTKASLFHLALTFPERRWPMGTPAQGITLGALYGVFLLLSALNILPAVVVALKQGEGPGVIAQLRAGEDVILARLTRRSAEALDLAPGRSCHAIVKSVAVARGDIGRV